MSVWVGQFRITKRAEQGPGLDALFRGWRGLAGGKAASQLQQLLV